ncbi:oligosaccharide flippase family protein [Algoriphagus boritolerans]|uniref:oligosaccharide flippase family protein n=1 Tax=Algoriphagus boritolerans TaxID=308111 RepID=UPI003A10027D
MNLKILRNRKKPIATWFWTQLTISIFFSMVIISFSKSLSAILFDSPNYYGILILGSLQMIFYTFTSVLQKWLRFQRKAFTTVSLTLATSLLNIALTILFVIYFEWGIEGIFFSNASQFILELFTLFIYDERVALIFKLR